MSGKDERPKTRRRLDKECSNWSEEYDDSERIGVSDDESVRTQRPNVIISETPITQREFEGMLDNFGKSHSEPAVKHNVREEVSEKSCIYENLTFTESQRILPEEIYVAKEESSKLKTSSEETTEDGKIIEICEEGHVCHEECTCQIYNQSLSEVDPLPVHYTPQDGMNAPETSYYDSKQEVFQNVSSASPPLNVKKVKKHMDKSKAKNVTKEKLLPVHTQKPKGNIDECFTETVASVSCSEVCPERGYTNRYNYNHVHIVRGKDSGLDPLRKLCEQFFSSKKKYKQKNIKNYAKRSGLFENDSGETIPQLYKAKLRQLSGAVPERFTFKAYNGASPQRDTLEGQEVFCDVSKTHHHTHHQHLTKCAEDYYPPFVQEKKHKDHKKEVAVEKNLNIKNKLSKDFASTRACLNFEGNEYISTRELPERIDIYCFDHLNTSYFRTSDHPPPLITEVAMERTEAIATRFWAEIFGFVHIFFAFLIAFILQLYKFLLYSLIRPLMIGIVQLTSDYFFKPLLTIIYNGFTQPLLVFIFNVAASFRDVCFPIARGIGYFFAETAVLLRAIRIIDLSKPPPQPAMKDFSC